MSGTVNKVILVGNLGKDPDIRMIQQGQEVASFSLATSDVWKDKASGERKERTEWHRVVVWAPGLISVVRKYVKKGDKIYIEGELQTRKFQDQNGADRYATEVVLQPYSGILTLLSAKDKADTPASESSPEDKNKPADDMYVFDDSIPF